MTSYRAVLISAAFMLTLALPASASADLVLPDGDIVREGRGLSGTTVSWRPPTVDAGDLIGASCDPDSGSAFPTGRTKVECSGAVRICPPRQLCLIDRAFGDFTVTVTPGVGPALSGVADRAAQAAPGAGSAVVTFPLPTASDPSGVDQSSVACAPASGSAFPVGDTQVACQARDTLGNESTASFAVRIAPAAAPETPRSPDAPAAPPERPAVPAARAVQIGRKLGLRRRDVRVKVSCPAANPIACAGTLELKSGRSRIGSARFSVAAGRTSVVRVRLGRTARRALARRKLTLRAVATTRNEAGARLTGARTFKVKKKARR